jgi:hypothetical protein
MESGHNALKAAMLINGGAAVAFLAFLGNLLAKSQSVKMAEFPKALLCFVFGVLLSAMASASTYFTQHSYRHRSMAAGNRVRGVTICLVILSYILFAAGALIAYRGFEAVK